MEVLERMTASLVQMVPRLHEQLQIAKTLLQRQITATDKQIDKLVYDLYGLTEEEIAIVEEATE